MKRATFLLAIPIIGSLAMLQSCQSEEETIGTGISSQRFLSVKEEKLKSINFCSPDTNYVNFHEAITRILDYKNGEAICKVSRASDANVSPSLFEFIRCIVDKDSKTRVIEPGGISTSEYDCTACTLTNVYAELLHIGNYNTRKNIYKRVWEYMCYEYGSYGLQDDERGVGFSNLLRRFFKYVALMESPVKMYTPTGLSDYTDDSAIIAVI